MQRRSRLRERRAVSAELLGQRHLTFAKSGRKVNFGAARGGLRRPPRASEMRRRRSGVRRGGLSL